MDELRQRVARGDYSVDSDRVAGSLVAKMRLIRLARQRLGAPQQRHERRDRA
ncbi:MAG: hypothetical protein ACR2OC_00640 [Solirubrobacterales bacterium]